MKISANILLISKFILKFKYILKRKSARMNIISLAALFIFKAVATVEIEGIDKEGFLKKWNFLNSNNFTKALKVLCNQETIQSCRTIFQVGQVYEHFTDIDEMSISDELKRKTDEIMAENHKFGVITTSNAIDSYFKSYFDVKKAKAYLLRTHMVKIDVTRCYEELGKNRYRGIGENLNNNKDMEYVLEILKSRQNRLFSITTSQETLNFTIENIRKLKVLNDLMKVGFFRNFVYWLPNIEQNTEGFSHLKHINLLGVRTKSTYRNSKSTFANITAGLKDDFFGENQDFEFNSEERKLPDLIDYLKSSSYKIFNQFNTIIVCLQEYCIADIDKFLRLHERPTTNL